MNEFEGLNKEIESIKKRNQNLEDSVSNIFARNKKVEIDKAWEVSWARKIIIILISYVAIGCTLAFFGFSRAWISAIIPVLAFILSTLSLVFLKSLWLKYLYKK